MDITRTEGQMAWIVRVMHDGKILCTLVKNGKKTAVWAKDSYEDALAFLAERGRPDEATPDPLPEPYDEE